MASYDDPATAALRLSNADRDAAVSALSRALADGRITADEFTERSASARAAVTRGDLAPLFADLPDTVHEGEPAPASGFQPAAPAAAPAAPAPRDDYDSARRRPLWGSAGVVIVSIMPFIALGLFFLCGYFIPDGFRWSWIFFALIPIAGIVVYGAGSRRSTP
ncbi:DUF1707 domain-containing protein [Herbiconiux moechotypicola]|uniref:DUF1707 domain-containing protein n=1 Tax=Herbiconiux moechotypicola TaxID=637393 RepID=A0ABP5Q9R6_9MICO|nr:DUF1707 domain-containing protein [Herbiconiux moechotypicola]MCS5728771.1 DUF1707 domain-containing protein [Herbiconiux moechotypicola]